MKFSDIDFSALGRIFDNMSDEEKAQLDQYAQDMMDGMNFPPPPPVEEQESEEESSFYETLGIDEKEYSHLPEQALNQIEAAVDFEDYYEDTPEEDFSASVLFYAKAVLTLLRTYHYPLYKDILGVDLGMVQTTTIQSFLETLNEDAISKLTEKEFGTEKAWHQHKSALQQIDLLLKRAEYDFVSIHDLQALETILFKEDEILRIGKLTGIENYLVEQ